MPEERLFTIEERTTRTGIAETLREAAGQIESGDVQLESDTEEQTVAVPERPQIRGRVRTAHGFGNR